MAIIDVSLISKYRTQLMGVATLLIILVHSYQQGVLMTEWMESLCNIGSIGVDIFLLVSGLGMWYSLEKDSVILYNNTPPSSKFILLVYKTL